MNKRILRTLFIIGLAAFVFGCSSDKSSNEACLHKVTMDLDAGNYDAVLASPCADDMAKGAAWFGKAGFDITDVINSLISANTSSTNTDLSIYMTSLVPKTLGSASLTDLDEAKFNYNLVPLAPVQTYKDAQFYISLVDTVKSLSLMKLVLPNIVGPGGTLNTACDYNSNAVPDDGDATSCELIASTNINSAGSIPCNGATYSPSAPAPISLFTDTAHNNKIVSNATSTITIDQFSGLIISMSIGTNLSPDTSGCNPAGATTYKRLLYQDPVTSAWYGATTTTDVCYGSDGDTWPCPVTGPNLDLVGSINASMNSSTSALISSGTSTSNAGQSITTLQQTCTTPCTAVCPGLSCPSTCTPPTYAENYCSSLDIANYIETNLQ